MGLKLGPGLRPGLGLGHPHPREPTLAQISLGHFSPENQAKVGGDPSKGNYGGVWFEAENIPRAL